MIGQMMRFRVNMGRENSCLSADGGEYGEIPDYQAQGLELIARLALALNSFFALLTFLPALSQVNLLILLGAFPSVLELSIDVLASCISESCRHDLKILFVRSQLVSEIEVCERRLRMAVPRLQLALRITQGLCFCCYMLVLIRDYECFSSYDDGQLIGQELLLPSATSALCRE